MSTRAKWLRGLLWGGLAAALVSAIVVRMGFESGGFPARPVIPAQPKPPPFPPADLGLDFDGSDTTLIASVRSSGRLRNARNAFRLIAFEPRSPGATRSIGRCAGAFVAYDQDYQAVYSVELSALSAHVTLRDLNGAMLRRSVRLSPVGPRRPPTLSWDGASGTLSVLHRTWRGFRLFLWWPNDGRRRDVAVPRDFHPSLAMPPYIARDADRMCLVSDDYRELAGLSLADFSWSFAAIKPNSTEWQWRPWASASERRGLWQLGDGSSGHLLLVDTQRRFLWATSAVKPLPDDVEPSSSLWPDATLEQLDLADRRVVSPPAALPGPRGSGHDGVWAYADAMIRVSGAKLGAPSAIIYNQRTEGRGGCAVQLVEHEPSGHWHWNDRILYQNSEVPVNCSLAVSSDGSLLAVPHVTSDGRLMLSLFTVPQLEEVASWPLAVAWK